MSEADPGSSRDWAKIMRERELSGEDLYALVDGVLTEQNQQFPSNKPPGTPDEFWEPTAAHMTWDIYQVNMWRTKPDEKAPYSSVNVQVDSRRDREDFQLRKYPDGKVKAFWFPKSVDSILLDETLNDEPVEISLTPNRTKRIGQVMISAHAVSMAGTQPNR